MVSLSVGLEWGLLFCVSCWSFFLLTSINTVSILFGWFTCELALMFLSCFVCVFLSGVVLWWVDAVLDVHCGVLVYCCCLSWEVFWLWALGRVLWSLSNWSCTCRWGTMTLLCLVWRWSLLFGAYLLGLLPPCVIQRGSHYHIKGKRKSQEKILDDDNNYFLFGWKPGYLEKLAGNSFGFCSSLAKLR